VQARPLHKSEVVGQVSVRTEEATGWQQLRPWSSDERATLFQTRRANRMPQQHAPQQHAGQLLPLNAYVLDVIVAVCDYYAYAIKRPYSSERGEERWRTE